MARDSLQGFLKQASASVAALECLLEEGENALGPLRSGALLNSVQSELATLRGLIGDYAKSIPTVVRSDEDKATHGVG